MRYIITNKSSLSDKRAIDFVASNLDVLVRDVKGDQRRWFEGPFIGLGRFQIYFRSNKVTPSFCVLDAEE
jgi:hypothetical protein